MKPLNQLSLGWRADLMFPRFDGQVILRPSYLVVRTPQNPTFWWGNFLLFDHPPASADAAIWLSAFDVEIASLQSESRHIAFGIDATGSFEMPGDLAWSGFTRHASVVLTMRREELLQEKKALESGFLSEETDLWLVDPLDGTSNFVEGKPCFSVMVALVRRGETVASWMLDPLTDKIAVAEKGGGAYLGGERIITARASPAAHELRGAVLTRFLPPTLRAQIETRRHQVREILPGLRCAGHEYPAVATGGQHFALFWRTEPWDHVPGALFITEAGGCAARLDRTPYAPADQRKGLLVAQNWETWNTVESTLLA